MLDKPAPEDWALLLAIIPPETRLPQSQGVGFVTEDIQQVPHATHPRKYHGIHLLHAVPVFDQIAQAGDHAVQQSNPPIFKMLPPA